MDKFTLAMAIIGAWSTAWAFVRVVDKLDHPEVKHND